ncbi:hypothetical protein [Clostridium sp.]|uniref:hypothetical protein n=1 Tax=Clostridium sp. TaxID=1506 RepID=UPI003D6D844D
MIINNEEITTLKAKITEHEQEIIQNHKTLELNKSEITFLQIKISEKDKIINFLENRVDELTIINKNYEDQFVLQSKKVISYLEKIKQLQNNLRTLETSLEDDTMSANTSILKRIFKNIN